MTIKSFARRYPFLVDLYYSLDFIKKAFVQNLFNIPKFMLYMRVRPYTMVSYERLSNAYEIAQTVEVQKLPGAFVECGVWKGGTIGLMAYGTKNAGSGRGIWLFDSFEGLPEPTLADGTIAGDYSSSRQSGKLDSIGRCVGPLEDVKRLFFSILKLEGKNIHIEKGWFQHTLPEAKSRVGKISILRMDADWYESTKCVLENLFDSVVPGGYVIIDDYGHWEGCKKAVDEFLHKRGITVDLKDIDGTGAYFQKQS